MVLRAAQHTRFRGLGGYSPEAFAAKGDKRPHPQADRERSLLGDFFALFPGFPVAAALRDRDVLDFGSGYGGRTVGYAAQCGARQVFGVEPVDEHIARSIDYARAQGQGNVDFRVCGATTIPLPDASVDVVVSYDVLEHVASPPESMREIHRVLRPGGRAFLVFPVYLGARAHHLDYMTTLPGLHWLFSPEAIVHGVNRVLQESPPERFGTALQPAPGISFDGRHAVLPNLNGLGSRHLASLFAGFQKHYLERHVILRSKAVGGRVTRWFAGRHAPWWLQDALTDSIAVVLERPDISR